MTGILPTVYRGGNESQTRLEFRSGSELVRDRGKRDLWSSVCSLESLNLCHPRGLCLFLGSLPGTVGCKPSHAEKTPQSHSPVSAWGLDTLLAPRTRWGRGNAERERRVSAGPKAVGCRVCTLPEVQGRGQRSQRGAGPSWGSETAAHLARTPLDPPPTPSL